MTAEQLVALIGAVTALLVALGVILQQIVSLRRQVDGRLTQLLELTATSSTAEGKLTAELDHATRAAAAQRLPASKSTPAGP